MGIYIGGLVGDYAWEVDLSHNPMFGVWWELMKGI